MDATRRIAIAIGSASPRPRSYENFLSLEAEEARAIDIALAVSACHRRRAQREEECISREVEKFRQERYVAGELS